MKKLLIVLMVIAMASFLFVGCMPGVTPPGDDEGEDEDVGVKTATPIITDITDAADVVIISLTSTDTQYMSKDEVADGIIVHGNAPKYSEVNVYVDDEVVGTSTVYGAVEIFEVFVAKADLGADGAKTLYATATESGLDESAHSTEYAFTLDVAAPTIASVVGDSSSSYITVTFSEPVDADTVEDATWTYMCSPGVYLAPVDVPESVVATSTTTAILYEDATITTNELLTDSFLSVMCATDAVEDSAGNEMVIPVIVFGIVVE